MTNPTRILAAVDFSDRSRVALGVAARLACRFDAELHVMRALDPSCPQQRGHDLTPGLMSRGGREAVRTRNYHGR